jgi:hypothetical protein
MVLSARLGTWAKASLGIGIEIPVEVVETASYVGAAGPVLKGVEASIVTETVERTMAVTSAAQGGI